MVDAIRRRTSVLSLLLTTGALAISQPAAAQDVSAEAAAPQPADADGDQIKDIVVTARRRDETLQQTPLAITAIAPSSLEAKATLNIGDLQGVAPNVLITQQNSGAAAANVSIRGLSFADVDKSFESTVAIVVDGVFIGTSTGAFLDFFDIDSIEVLRGPQGTLFGRNTIGGVINIRRSRPTGTFGGKVEASYGRFDSWSTRAVVNAPIVDGVLAAKGFYFHNQSDGYYRNGITGKRAGGSNNENFGASFLFTPTENFDALLTLEKQVQDFDPVNSNITRTGELFCGFVPANQCNRNTTTDLYTVFNSPAHSHYEAPAATLEMNLKLDPVTLTSITSYRESSEHQTQDFDASTADLYYADRTQNFRQFSQELRAAGNATDSLDYVVGAYFYDHRYDLEQITRFFGAVDPNATQYTVGKSQSYAFFGDFNWKLAEKVRLSFGGRWTHDRKQNALRLGSTQFPNATYSGSKFTPKVSVDYRPNETVMVYGSWSRGYRSGGFSGRGLTEFSSTTSYGPETVDSYEAGLKTAFFDRRLLFNISAFLADYSDLQQNTTVPTTGGVGNETVVSNVGSAKIKGIELDVTARPVRGLTLTGALGLLDSNFRNFVTPALNPATGTLANFDYSAVNMIYAPKLTLSLNAEYRMPTSFGEWTTNVGYRYLARYDQQVSIGATQFDAATNTVVVLDNDPRVRSDRQNLLDASTTISFDLGDKKARATLFARNLLNDRGPNAAFTVAGLFAFSSAREPRTYGLQLGFEF